MMSITKALQQADDVVSDVYRCGSGPNGWGFQTWSERHRAWWLPGHGTSYSGAQSARVEALAEAAAKMIHASRGGDPDDVFVVPGECVGSVRRARRLVEIALADAERFLPAERMAS